MFLPVFSFSPSSCPFHSSLSFLYFYVESAFWLRVHDVQDLRKSVAPEWIATTPPQCDLISTASARHDVPLAASCELSQHIAPTCWRWALIMGDSPDSEDLPSANQTWLENPRWVRWLSYLFMSHPIPPSNLRPTWLTPKTIARKKAYRYSPLLMISLRFWLGVLEYECGK